MVETFGSCISSERKFIDIRICLGEWKTKGNLYDGSHWKGLGRGEGVEEKKKTMENGGKKHSRKKRIEKRKSLVTLFTRKTEMKDKGKMAIAVPVYPSFMTLRLEKAM